jgi:hypothetical protein
MSVGTMYKQWRDATPTITFPFSYKDKTDGVISQTWKDVREKLNRDAVNTSLAFCTAHIAPSAYQANIVSEVIRKEDHVRAHHPSAIRQREREASASAQRHPRALSPLTTAEKDALFNGEGGGRSRVEFLKLRRQRPLNERFSYRVTTQQVYGWEINEQQSAARASSSLSHGPTSTLASPSLPSSSPSPALTVTSPSGNNDQGGAVAANFFDVPVKKRQPAANNDHRRKSASKEWGRASGVFAKSDGI